MMRRFSRLSIMAEVDVLFRYMTEEVENQSI